MPNLGEKAGIFFKEAKQELKKVNWPTRKETFRLTMFVVIFSLLIAAFLGILDLLFVRALDIFII